MKTEFMIVKESKSCNSNIDKKYFTLGLKINTE